jgi:hypothetical protein
MKTGLLVTITALLWTLPSTPAEVDTYTFSQVTTSDAHAALGLAYSESSGGTTLMADGFTAPANCATAGPTSFTLCDRDECMNSKFMAADGGHCTPDAGTPRGALTAAAFDGGLNAQSAHEPGRLMLAGSALIVIGMAMKKRRKNV